MVRESELELHRRAKALFEAENPPRLWRQATGAEPAVGQRYAELFERQEYLVRARDLMRREGIKLVADEEALSTAARRPNATGPT